MTRRGRLIALEGIDGAGTTTQLTRLAAHLRARGLEVHETAEPSRGPIGEVLRRALRHQTPMSDVTLIPLFAADRLHHVEHEIEPVLARGGVVVSDRYLLSSLAYQSLCADLTWVREVNRHAPPADLNVYVRVGLDVARARRAARGGHVERFDDDDKQARVIAAYDALMQRADVGPCVVIDGEGGVDEVAARLAAAVEAHL